MRKILLMMCILLMSGCVVKEPEVKSGTIKSYDLASRDFEIVETADIFMVGDALLHGAVYKQAEKRLC